MDDFALFSDSKPTAWVWKQRIIERLQAMRLTVHESAAQVQPVSGGIPWLGFVIHPEYRRVKSRKVLEATRRLSERFDACQSDRISFGEFDASIEGWINPVGYADRWGLREHVLSRFVWTPMGRSAG